MPIDDIENDPTTQMLMQALGQGFGQNWGQQQQQQAPQQQVSVPTPPPAPPAPSPFDQYEQSLIEKLKNDSPEARKDQKVRDYFKDLGIDKPNSKSWKQQIMVRMHEAGLSAQANANRNPHTTTNLWNDYKNQNDRLSAEAQKEYEKENPLMRSQVSEIFKTQRDREQNATTLERERMRQAQVEKHTLMLGQIANGRNEIAKLQNDVKNKVAGADIALSQAKAKHLDMVTQVLDLDKDTHLLSPQMRDALKLEEIDNKSGADAANNILRNMSDMSNMKAPPSPAKAVATNDTPTWQRSLERMTELEKAKAFSKPAGSNSAYTVRNMLRVNPDGSMTSEPAYIPKNPGEPAQKVMLPRGMEGNNPSKQRIAEAFDQGGIQAEGALGAVISLVQQGKDTDVMGPTGGNLISRAARIFGISDSVDPLEALKLILTSNAIQQHTKGMLGGSRFAYQAIEDMKKTTGTSPAATARTVISGLGALKYSIDKGKLQNAGLLEPGDVSNTLATRIQVEIKRAADQAFADQTWNKLNPQNPRQTKITLRPLRELLDEDRAQSGNSNGKSLTLEEKVRRKYLK